MRTLGTIAVITLACVGGSPAFANDSTADNPFTPKLTAVSAVELPATAAKLVKDAKFSAREATTIKVVRAALVVNPAAATSVVGAIADAVPDMAATAAATAASEQPKQVAAIAKAAASAAPGKAGKIVLALCTVLPNENRTVALAVSEAAPNSNKEVLKAVGYAIPAMKASIDKQLADSSVGLPPVDSTLERAQVVAGIQAQAAPVAPSAASATAPAVPVFRGAPSGLPSVGAGAVSSSSPIDVGSQGASHRNYAQPR